MLLIWEPPIIRYFLDHGADFIKDSPFAIAFGERIRTVLGPWKECREKYADFARQLREQPDRALRHFAFKQDLKWVSLLMWAGADPRSSGPTLDDDYDLDESGYITALTAGAYCENLEILKRLKPDAKKDNLDVFSQLPRELGTSGSAVLVELGAKPNDKPNGGSTTLDNLERFRYESFRSRIYFTGYDKRPKASKYHVPIRL